jgi:aspartate kinase
MKFGGSSVKNAAAMTNAADIILKRLPRKPLVVVSALGGVTDQLIEMLAFATAQNQGNVQDNMASLRQRHLQLINQLINNKTIRKRLEATLDAELERLQALLAATSAIRVESGKLAHAVMSVGELLSSAILSAYLESRGKSTFCFDARQVITVNFDKIGCIPLDDVIRNKARQQLLPLMDSHELVVTQGFIALTQYGAPATLGRDGSDYTASLLGAALDAEEIQIWSDVDGILTADPGIVPEASPLQMMSFHEACELAYFGARVLHPKTIQPAMEKNIAVRVLNSHRPDEQGTLIVSASTGGNGAPVKSIAYKEGITLLTIESSNLLLSPLVIQEIFNTLTRHGKPVYAVSKSATKLSITIESSVLMHELIAEIETFGQVVIEPGKTIVSVVGEKLKRNPALTWQIIRLLNDAGIHLDLISQFADQISLMFIIDESNIEKTVRLLHDKLIAGDHEN